MSNLDITDLVNVDAVPGLSAAGDCLNINADHAVITLLYNILVKQDEIASILTEIEVNTTPL